MELIARIRTPRRIVPGGFTLTEVAIVLVIVGFLLVGLMYTLSAQMEQRRLSETQQRLESAREALLGFAIANGRLPCPARYVDAATHSNGMESFCNLATGPCAATDVVKTHGVCSNFFDGYVPAKAIGLREVDALGFAVDAWGNRLRYAVAKDVLSPGVSCPAIGATKVEPGLTSAGNLKTNGIGCAPDRMVVCAAAGGVTSTTCGSAVSVTNQNVVAAVLFSTGKNTLTTGGASADEAANLDGDGVFVSRPPSPGGAATGEFDDIMLWIPSGVLYGRMVAAGILP